MGLQQQAAAQQQQSLDAANSLQQQQLKSSQDAAAVAAQGQISAIQRSVSVDTWNLLKQFGQRAAIAGSNLAVPLSTATGGFAQAPATASGAPR